MAYALPFPASTIPTGGTFGDLTPPRTARHRGTDYSKTKGARGPIPSVCHAKLVAKGYSTIVGYWSEWQSLEGDTAFFTYAHNTEACPLPVGTIRNGRESIGQTVGGTGSAARGDHLHLALSRTKGGGLSGAVQDPHAYILAKASAAAGGNATLITDPGDDMAQPFYYIASSNNASVTVGAGDIWVRNAPGEPLLRLTSGQAQEYFTRDSLDYTSPNVKGRAGSWFDAAFAEDAVVAGYNQTVHPWLKPSGAAAAIDLGELATLIAGEIDEDDDADELALLAAIEAQPGKFVKALRDSIVV